MFCPECGTQNPDPMRFCVSCGYQNPLAGGAAGGAAPPQAVGYAPAKSGPNYALFIAGGLGLVVIAGLIGFILFRNNSNASTDEGNPTPRPRVASNTVASAPAASNPTSSQPASPSSDLSDVEKKAQAFVGKWVTQIGKDTVTITYGTPNKQGDAFVVPATLSQKGKPDQSSTLIVSRDEWIKEIDNTGKEFKLKAELSADGSRMAINLTDGVAMTLVKMDPSATTSGPTTAAAPQPAAPKKKPVNCDNKCYRVYDQCMADYRQNPDPESICRAKQQSCLINCQ